VPIFCSKNPRTGSGLRFELCNFRRTDGRRIGWRWAVRHFYSSFTSNRTFTEIPEPDYDDDDDDDDDPLDADGIDQASCFYDNQAEEEKEEETFTQRDDADEDDDKDGDSDRQQVNFERPAADDDLSCDFSYDFDGVRAKLEAFSRNQLQLRGSVSTADQGCGIICATDERCCWAPVF